MVKTALSLTFTPLNTVICEFLYFLGFFYFQNNAWNTHHWSVFKLLLGTWWVGNQLCYRFQFTGPGGIIQLVNCNQHYYKYNGYRKFILWNCFSYYLFLLCFGHYDCNRNLARQKKKDNENSRKQWIQPEPSSSSNSLKKMNKTRKWLLQHIDTM